tara:strand:- start:9 stop:959 length:951 start_codon:yes stop_codon:yes gene_type:complete
MKHSLIISVLFSSFYLFAQDSSAVYSHKLNQLRSELGVSAETDFDQSVYSRLVNRLESLGIEDEQLEDGFEWGGGKIGFEAYLKNNIDRLLSDFKIEPILSDSLIKEKIDLPADNHVEVQQDLIEIEQEVETVKDLVVVKTSTKKDKKRKKKKRTSGKSMLTGLRLGSGLGKPLAKGASLSDHASFFEPALSIRTPLGIGIGPVYTSLGYESNKYSFEAPADTIASYFGSGSGPALFFNLGKIIKFGGENLEKYFILGISSYDHGSGFIGGYDLNMFLGSLPVSISVSSRMNIVSFDTGGTTYWASASAGIGIDMR